MTPCVPPADGFQEMMEPVPERSCPGPTLCCRAQGCVAESRDGGCHTQPLPGNPSATPASPPALPASRLTAEQWQPPSCWNPILPLCAATSRLLTWSPFPALPIALPQGRMAPTSPSIFLHRMRSEAQLGQATGVACTPLYSLHRRPVHGGLLCTQDAKSTCRGCTTRAPLLAGGATRAPSRSTALIAGHCCCARDAPIDPLSPAPLIPIVNGNCPCRPATGGAGGPATSPHTCCLGSVAFLSPRPERQENVGIKSHSPTHPAAPAPTPRSAQPISASPGRHPCASPAESYPGPKSRLKARRKGAETLPSLSTAAAAEDPPGPSRGCPREAGGCGDTTPRRTPTRPGPQGHPRSPALPAARAGRSPGGRGGGAAARYRDAAGEHLPPPGDGAASARPSSRPSARPSCRRGGQRAGTGPTAAAAAGLPGPPSDGGDGSGAVTRGAEPI